jgi:hypothetical protein
MASYITVRAAIKEALVVGVSGIKVYEYIPDTLTHPAAVIAPGDPVVSFDATLSRGADEYTFLVRVLVDNAQSEVADKALDAYLAGSGSQSIKQAIEDDPRLGGVVDFVSVTQARNYGVYEFGGVSSLGVEFVVVASASGI